MILWLTHLG